MSIIIFLIVLCVLVLVHEWGHFIVAKKSGMRVDEFGIGFPPRLFGIKRSETLYSLNMFPIGGFVKIYGENADAQVGGSDFSRSFMGQNRFKQSAVLVAGVAMNVIFAWFLFTVAFASGVQSSIDESEFSPFSKLVVTEVMDGGPAKGADLLGGMTITGASVGNDTLTTLTPSAFSTFVSVHGGEEMVLTYTRGKETHTTTLVPVTGIIPDEETRAGIGVHLSLTDVVKQPILTAAEDAFFHTFRSIRDITVGIAGLIRDAVMLKADLTNVAGPVGIVGLVGEASAFGFSSLLMFTAFISLNLAVINLLPFPALDGGRLVFVIIEGIKGSAINPRYTQVLNTVGFALLIFLMVAVTWNDVLRLI